MYVLKKPVHVSFEKVGITGTIFPMSGLTARMSFVYIETVSGHLTTIIEHTSDFIYYVLEGHGHFIINDTKEECSRGDLVIIPAGNKFTYKGTMKLLLSCTPPWSESQEETIT